ncbi:MAG: hypothetical protein ACI3XA_04645 [Clostridia bacterium]
MTVREAYEKVGIRLGQAIDERVFISHLYDTLSELETIVKKKYLWLNKGAQKHPTLVSDDEIWCNELFHVAIIDNILFLCTGNAEFKSEFLRKASAAEKTAEEISNGNRMRIMRKQGW